MTPETALAGPETDETATTHERELLENQSTDSPLPGLVPVPGQAGLWFGRCPLHDDPLFGLSVGQVDGEVMVQCRTRKCSTSDVRAALGLPSEPPPSLSTHISEVEVRPLRWLVRNIWSYPGYGMVGGGEKAMKTWTLAALAVSVASGRDFLGRFPVQTSGPVLVLTGEGGASFWKRRAVKVAQALGVELDRLPLYVCDARLSLSDPRLDSELAQALDRETVLVIIDPLYSYVGGGHDAGNVFDMGDLLAHASDVVKDRASLVLGHHMNKSGSRGRPTLTDLTQAGSREWVHNWVLVWDKSWDPATGTATSGMEVGSREGYGSEWQVETCLGAFDDETCQHVGTLSWSVDHPTGTTSRTKASPQLDEAKQFLTAYLSTGPIPAKEVQDEGKAAGLSSATLRRAKEALQVQCRQHQGVWVWELPNLTQMLMS